MENTRHSSKIFSHSWFVFIRCSLQQLLGFLREINESRATYITHFYNLSLSFIFLCWSLNTSGFFITE